MSKILPKYKTHLIAVALALATFAVFSQVICNEFVYYDDQEYVTENIQIQNEPVLQTIKWAFTTGYAANWHPLTWLSHMLDYKLFGLDPAWHHLTNLLFHVANTLLLFILLKAMTGALWQSAFVAALFALHPLHVESVAWVSERKDLLSTLFWFFTMAAYLRYTRQPTATGYLLALFLFGLGLMAKPMLVTLPFVLLLLNYWPLKQFDLMKLSHKNNWAAFYRLVREKIPFFILSAISCIVTYVVQQHAMTDIEAFPLKLRIANAIVSYARYIEKMFLPFKLAILYPLAGNLPTLWSTVPAAILILVISIFVIRLSRNRRYLLVGWLWFIGTLVPVIGLVQVGIQTMADRYTYVPIIGLFIIVTWGATELLTFWKYRVKFLTVAAIVILLLLSTGTVLQLRHWRNTISLFQHAIAVTNKNYTAYNNLGYGFVLKDQFKQAIAYYNEAIRIKPDYADAYNNLGAAHAELHRYGEAAKAIAYSIQLKPDDAETYFNLGSVYKSLENWPKTIETLKQGLKIDPDAAEANFNLGLAYAATGRWTQAVDAYEKAIKIKADFANTYSNLAVAYSQLGRPDEEIQACKKAIEIDPNMHEAWHNLGIAYSSRARHAEAIESYKQVIKLKPDYTEAYYGLGLAYSALGDKDAALQQYQVLKTLDAKRANRLFNLIHK